MGCKAKEINEFIKKPSKNSFLGSDKGLDETELKNIDISFVKDNKYYNLFKSNELNEFASTRENISYLEKNGIKIDKNTGVKITDGKSLFDAVSKIAKIEPIKDIQSLYKAIHEITHLVINNQKDNGLYKELQTTFTEISNLLKNRDTNLDLQFVVDGKIKSFKDLTLGSDIDAFDREEYITTIIGSLITNDLIKSNKYLLAKIFGKDKQIFSLIDSFDEIQKIYIKDNNTGKTVPITTFSELQDILKKNEINISFNSIKKLHSYVLSIFNSSNEIKENLYGKPKNSEIDEPTKKYFQSIESKYTEFKNLTKKLHRGFLDDLGLDDLLFLNTKMEAMNKALSLYRGAKQMILELTNSAKEDVENIIKQIEPVEYEKVDDILGHMITFGMHYLDNSSATLDFTKTDKSFNVLKEFDLSKDDNIFYKVLTTDNKIAKGKLELTLKNILNKIEKEYNKKIRQDIEYHINKATFGSINSLYKLKSIIYQMHIKDDKHLLNSNEAMTLARKLIALNAFKEHIDKPYFNNKFKEFNNIVLNHSDKVNSLFRVFLSRDNDFTIFGENIELNFLKQSKNLKITDDLTGIPENNVIAEITIDDKKYYAIVGNRYNTKIGNQEPMMLDIDLDEFEKGIFEKKINNINYKLNAQNMKLHSSLIDKKISTQFQRNTYIKAKQDISKDLGYRQWKLLKDNGLILTKEEVNKILELEPEKKDRYIQLPDNHPLVKISGTKWYIDNKYAHFFLGTKGIDLAFNNTKEAKNFGLALKIFLDTFKELSKALLFIHPKVIINNFLGSMSLYMFNVKHNNPFIFFKDIKEAEKLYKEYKESIKLLQQLDLEYQRTKDEKIKQKYDELFETIKNSPIGIAFEYGFGDTLRTTALQVGAVEDLTMYHFIRERFGKNSEYWAKAFFINDNTKFGKAVGSLFEKGELYPKLALLLRKMKEFKKEGYSDKDAISNAVTVALHAFPMYNNLPQSLAMLDNVSPYTKFFLSVPRNTAFTFFNMPSKYITYSIIANSIPMLANTDNQNQDNWYEEHGYINLLDGNEYDLYLGTRWLDPILNPIATIANKPTLLDIGSWATATMHIPDKPIDIINYFTPLTMVENKK